MKMFYPLDKSIPECINTITAKPFSPSFKDQAGAAVSLYGRQFDIWFTEEDLKDCLKKAEGKYDKEILDRVYETLLLQKSEMEKFSSFNTENRLSFSSPYKKKPPCSSSQKS